MAVLLAGVALLAARTPCFVDFGLYLRSGYEVVMRHNVNIDVATFTHYGQAWNNHAWLGNVGFYGIHHVGGFSLLVALSMLAAVAGAWLTWLQMPTGSRSALPTLGMASLASVSFYEPRTHVATAICFAVTLVLIRRARDGHGKALLWAIPLTLAWSNLHGGYQGGLILLAASALGAWWNGQRDPDRQGEHRRLALALAAVGVAACVVAALNPNGAFRTYAVAIQTLRGGAAHGVGEWCPPFPFQVNLLPYFIMLAAMVSPMLSTVGSGRRFDGVEVVPFFTFAVMSLVSVRHAHLFILVAAPIMARHVDLALGDPPAGWALRGLKAMADFMKERVAPLVARHGLSIFVLVVLAVVARFYAATRPLAIRTAEAAILPLDAANWLAQQPRGRVFNEYDWGSYLAWRVPGHPVVIDIRIDLNDDGTIDAWKSVMGAKPGCDERLRAWGIAWVVVRPSRPLVQHLKGHGWSEVHRDRMAVVLKNDHAGE